MNRQSLRQLLACAALALPLAVGAAASNEFQIGIVAHPYSDPLADESQLRDTLAETDEANLAFIVVGGIKSVAEPCDDKLYERRKALFEDSKNGLIVSVAASDWSDCRYSNGKTAALERLNRLREVFFTDDLSFGATKLPLIRQSASARFRSFSENARWEFNDIMFATVNLPANNNRYIAAAGRNGEFEDRWVANRDWLQRVVNHAKRKKFAGIVLFSDGSPLRQPAASSVRRDGFAETRQLLTTLAANFPGKILLVHNRAPGAGTRTNSPSRIVWDGNLGDLSVESEWITLYVTPARTMPFSVVDNIDEKPRTAKK